MRNLIARVLSFVAVSSIIFIGACGDDDASAVDKGIIIIGVTDKPDEDISAIVVTTNLIEGNVRTSESENESDWQILLNVEKSFDLIEVAGVEKTLGEAEIPAATYNQIRMHVTSVVVTLNGKDVEAKVPSGIIKLVRPFKVKAEEKIVVTFDFDAEKSVVVTGSDTVIFKPVVKLLVRKGNEPFRAETTTREEEKAEEKKGKGESTSEFSPMIYGDEDGFFLKISNPEQPEVIVETDTILIAGETSVDAAVSIGDEFVDVNLDGTFEKVVNLEDGINFFEVIASISSEQQYNQVLTVIYTP
ncbi:MAG TPA: DUF4382 domain-containing protein [Dehalococcoidia bacterium]|nr:DUF4382 domain-containing protein [Dehalococcoidia bacterium]